ncbi:MAG TPA: amidohydrolase family protein [Chloroflexota bacterium]|nr:amidohydrolase family protein [Chloroflexota bacterium]
MARSYRRVSGDSHLQVPADAWTHRVPAAYRDQAPRRVKRPDGGQAIVAADGSAYFGATGSYAGHTPETFDPMVAFDFDTAVGAGPPAQRIAEQDRDGVDAELLFPGTSAIHGIAAADRPAYLAMVRAYNEYLAEEYCAIAPDRLFGVGMLPTKDVDLKIQEMERCKRLGLRAVGLHDLPSGQTYPTVEDDRFWAAALDLGMPVCIHTTISRRSGQLFQYSRTPASERPPDDFIDRLYRHANPSRCGALTACQLVFAGVFDRFPSLQIYWAENNVGWIPFYFEQLDAEYAKNHVWAERHFGIPRLARRPSEIIRDHSSWGFYDDRIGIKLRYEIGPDRIVWGSDFPHVVTAWPNSSRLLAEQMADVPTAERQAMEAGNLLRFLGIDVDRRRDATQPVGGEP